jgi:hypothetical protein
MLSDCLPDYGRQFLEVIWCNEAEKIKFLPFQSAKLSLKELLLPQFKILGKILGQVLKN